MDERIKIIYASETVPHFSPVVLSKETLELMEQIKRDIEASFESVIFEHTVDQHAEVCTTRASWLLPAYIA